MPVDFDSDGSVLVKEQANKNWCLSKVPFYNLLGIFTLKCPAHGSLFLPDSLQLWLFSVI